MYIDTDKIMTMTAANLSEDERIDVVARRVMKRHKAAFLELAK